MHGYAGTGKSTLVNEITRGLEGVVHLAPTGKAAAVMRRKGCEGARTIHSYIYQPPGEIVEEVKRLRQEIEAIEGKDPFDARLASMRSQLEWLRQRLQNPSWILRLSLDPPPRLIVVDEASMVSEALARDILSFGVKVLAIGDPGQLPPVHGDALFMSGTPDVMLTEVHRQALESPVLRMATHVRHHGAGSLPYGQYHLRYGSLAPASFAGMILEADQVLVGRNATRRRLNATMREMSGLPVSPAPVAGEKLVCLRNANARPADGGDAEIKILNGTQWRVDECVDDGFWYRARLTDWDGGGDSVVVKMHREPFAGQDVLPENRFDAHEFDFGYALTVHKAQGSQWDDVVIINDWTHRETHDRWLYTGLTRAVERATVISAAWPLLAKPW